MVEGFKKDGIFRPIGSGSGVAESSFHEGSHKNILGTPVRKYSSGLPSPEKQATLNKMSAYVKGFNERVKGAHASGQARKDEEKKRREKMIEEANKNMELASKFFANAELLKHGKTPTQEVKIEKENTKSHHKLPTKITPEQQKKIDQLKEQQLKSEIKVIEKIAQSSQPRQPDIPIMPEGVPKINYSQVSEPESQYEEPKPKSSKNLDEQALEVFPVMG